MLCFQGRVWHKFDEMPTPDRNRRPVRPLDAATLHALALAYVARYATTSAKLKRYLDRKIAERGWSEGSPADVQGIVARMAELRYIDDEIFAQNRAEALRRRGYGAGRVRLALASSGIARDLCEQAALETPEEARDAAIRYAQRRRFGCFGETAPDRKLFEKQLAAMVRAGHGFEIARVVLTIGKDD